MDHTRENREALIQKWCAIVREASAEALDAALPNIVQDSLPYVKLQMLTRASLVDESKRYMIDAGDAAAEEVEDVVYEIRPPLIEELIPPTMPPEVQAEISVFLMRCLDGGESFSLTREVLNELLPNEKAKRFEVAGILLKTGSDALRRLCADMQNRADQTKPGLTFPEGYPYMDEFEYIDHNISGDDD